MIRRLRAALLFLLLLSLGGVAAAAPAPASGPAWWRISDGKTTLWILAVPDGMLMNTAWSDASLRHRLSAAKLLLLPLLGDGLIGAPESEGCVSQGPVVDCASYPIPSNIISTRPAEVENYYTGDYDLKRIGNHGDDPELYTYKDYSVADRLGPALTQRVTRQLVRAPARFSNLLLHERMDNLALWLDLWNWPPGKLGNPITRRAQDIAQKSHLATKQIMVRGLWRPMLIDYDKAPDLEYASHWESYQLYQRGEYNVRTPPTQATMSKCLEMALSQAESGQMPALRQAAMAAWARGDVANALKRAGPIQLCLMGTAPSSDAQAFLNRRAATYEQDLDQAFDGSGAQTVALVEFDPLLEKGGILDHYKALGYDIAQTDGMGE